MNWSDMTPEQRRATLQAMCNFGGSFVYRLAMAWICADAINAAKLAEVFPELIAEYGPGSTFFEGVSAQQWVQA